MTIRVKVCCVVVRNGGNLTMGGVTLPGWSSGAPELHVTWRTPTADRRGVWGEVKALCGR